ncbi:restriction endonuclease subunit S [Gammaproteobacteria bacterium]|nr:restriction endonuclease subunit S [Gammaproteobacteria bacterium]
MNERVPEGWSSMRLGEVTTQTRGLTYKSEDYGDGLDGHPFLTLKSISKSGGYSSRGLKFYKGNFKPHHLIENGDILFANTDLTRAGDVVGSPLYFDKFEFKTKPLYSMDLSKLVVDSSKSDGKFLYYLLMVPRIKRFMINVSAGSTVLHLDTKSVKNLSILLPPLPEQKKIASILSSVDEVIEKTQLQINKLQDLKKGTMNELLTKGIGHTEFKDSELGRIPKSWEVVPLSKIIINFDSDRIPVKSTDRQGMQGKYRYYGASGIIDYVDNYLFDGSFILLGEDGENVLSRNLPLAFIVNGKFWVNNHAHILQPVSGVDIKFLCEFLESIDYKNIASGSAQPKITKSSLNEIRVALPSNQEQKRISVILYSIDEQINFKNKKLHQIQSLKKSLMQDLLTGKVRVTVN